MSRAGSPSSMTVAALREALEGYDDDAIVLMVADYGDITHTQQALGITKIEESRITDNPYSKSGFALPYEGDDEPDEDDPNPIDCPRCDPECIGTDEMCHDACEAPELFVVLRS